MRIKYLQVALYIIYLIFCPYCFVYLLVLNQCACLILHKNHTRYVSEVYEHVVKALVIVTLRNWSDKNHPRWTVFYHELLWVRIYYSFWFFTIFRLLPISILITFKSQFSEKIINVTQVVERSSKRFFTIDGFRAVESRIGILHAVHRFDRLRFLESWLTRIERVTALRTWAVVRHFRTDFSLIKVIKIGKLTTLWLMGLTAIVLKSTGPFSDPQFLFDRILSQFLDRF